MDAIETLHAISQSHIIFRVNLLEEELITRMTDLAEGHFFKVAKTKVQELNVKHPAKSGDPKTYFTWGLLLA